MTTKYKELLMDGNGYNGKVKKMRGTSVFSHPSELSGLYKANTNFAMVIYKNNSSCLIMI